MLVGNDSKSDSQAIDRVGHLKRGCFCPTDRIRGSFTTVKIDCL